MVRNILDWNDKKFDEAVKSEDSDGKLYAKAFGHGALEGIIDAAAVVGICGIAKGIINIVKEFKK